MEGRGAMAVGTARPVAVGASRCCAAGPYQRRQAGGNRLPSLAKNVSSAAMDAHRRPGPPRRVTINDIAAATGVAASTVSRALTRPGRVNPATRERIEAAARELNYVPNTQARALTSGPDRDDRGARLRRHQPVLLRADPRRAAPAEGGRLRPAAHRHRGLRASWRRTCCTRCAAPSTARSWPRPGCPTGSWPALAAEMPIVTVNRNVRGVQSVVIDSPGRHRARPPST